MENRNVDVKNETACCNPANEGQGDMAKSCCCEPAVNNETKNDCCEPAESSADRSCCCQTTDADGNVRTKHRSEEEYRALKNRLKRIEGQIQGIQRMLENEAYCPDILVQVAAVNAALNGFNKELLASHLRSCVVSDIQSEDPGRQEAAVDELVGLLRKLMK